MVTDNLLKTLLLKKKKKKEHSENQDSKWFGLSVWVFAIRHLINVRLVQLNICPFMFHCQT